MKILKTLGLVALFAIIAVLLVGLFAQKEFTTERSIVIDASKDKVFEHLQYHSKRAAWYPWPKKDPNMKSTIEGEDGTVGAVSFWESDVKEVGKGSETITAITMNERIDSHMKFEEPMESEGEGWFTLNEVDGGTEVTWGMGFSVPYPFNAFMVFTDMDKEMEPARQDFDNGLADLKAIVEAETKQPVYDGYSINTVDFPGHTYLAVRENVKMDGISDFYKNQMGAIHDVCQQNKIEMKGAPTGLYYTWDEENRMSDMAAAIPVDETAEKYKNDGMVMEKISAAKALLVDYYGDYPGLGNAHNAIDKYMKDKNLRTKYPVIEEYITDPSTEPNQEKWLTKVYYFFEPNPVATTE